MDGESDGHRIPWPDRCRLGVTLGHHALFNLASMGDVEVKLERSEWEDGKKDG